MNKIDQEYFRLLRTILNDGRRKKNRTGVDTIGVFGEQAKFKVDMNAFPILTTKKVWFKGIVHELLWFIRGCTNITPLVLNDVHIWDEWAYARYKKAARGSLSQDEFIALIKNDPLFAETWGELGEGTYGGMWRAFPYHIMEPVVNPGMGESRWTLKNIGHVDQLKKVIDKLKTNADDRRMIVSAWHPYWVDHCALPPCHCLFHFNTEELTFEERKALHPSFDEYWGPTEYGQMNLNGWSDEKQQAHIESWLDGSRIPRRRLNVLLYQRSCDTFLGVPFNITSYSLLLAMVAHCVGMEPGVFTHTYGDLHIYDNHLTQVEEQLGREPKTLPKLWLNPEKRDLFDFKYEDIKLFDYDSHPTIKAPIAV